MSVDVTFVHVDGTVQGTNLTYNMGTVTLHV